MDEDSFYTMVREQVVDDILARRMKQLAKHPAVKDDQYTDGALALVAGILAVNREGPLPKEGHMLLALWPWPDWPFPFSHTAEDNLIDAAALIIAELERRYRAQASQKAIIPEGDQ